MYIKRLFSFLLGCTVLSGCASSSKDITPVYVSPLQYNDFSCSQIAAEQNRLRVRMTQLGGRLDESAENDKIIAGASVLLIYPIFFVGGNKDQEAEFARLLGEAQAVEEAAIHKSCHELPKKIATAE